MDYRPYRPGDFAQLYAIEEACFEPPLRFGRWYMQQLISGSRAATWIAEEDGRMAGFAIVEWSTASAATAAYIYTIEVAAELRGRGVGSELLRRVEGSARAAGAAAVWLHVDAGNAPAIRLYEAHGYRRQGREERYYGRGRAALIYSKPL
jgi:ribosomal protein S18 acetylase RimI-like enzyme